MFCSFYSSVFLVYNLLREPEQWTMYCSLWESAENVSGGAMDDILKLVTIYMRMWTVEHLTIFWSLWQCTWECERWSSWRYSEACDNLHENVNGGAVDKILKLVKIYMRIWTVGQLTKFWSLWQSTWECERWSSWRYSEACDNLHENVNGGAFDDILKLVSVYELIVWAAEQMTMYCSLWQSTENVSGGTMDDMLKLVSV